MSIFIVSTTCHGMQGIELIGGDPNHHKFLRWAVLMNRMDHPAYKLNNGFAKSFLQGQSNNPWWTLVEFWGKNYEPFVDWLNENVAKFE